MQKKIKRQDIAFTTYFDKNYLPKGLVMLESFCRYNPQYILFVLCFDDFTYTFLKGSKLKNVTPISLKDFEDKKLLKAKENRSLVEYYWTCTPSLPLYIFRKYKTFKVVCYLDADLCFYRSVNEAIEELGENSIYTVGHRYPKGQEGRNATSGIFNVAFQMFRRDREGLKCLNRWRKQCLDWCFWKEEDGKMGDQMYLNEWPDIYSNIVISKNVGIDTAPWNISQYKVTKTKDGIFIDCTPLICYHFHQLKILDVNHYEYASGYKFSNNVVRYIYKPYTMSLKKAINKITKTCPKYKIPATVVPISIKIKNALAYLIGPVYWRIITILKKCQN